MAIEVCSLSRTVSGSGGSFEKCGGVTNSLWSRKSQRTLSVDFRFGKSWNKVISAGRPQVVRSRSLPTIAIASTVSEETHGSLGALTSTDRPCSNQQPGVGSNVLENWLEKSLSEIVRHLPEAPFLQFVPQSSSLDVSDHSERQRVSEELFDKPETWGSVKQCLLDKAPEGIILVHRLDQELLSECCMNEVSGNAESSRSGSSLQAGGSSTDVWGVLVHGCRMQRNACYILKTTRVASTTGILTHFCVSRAKCFGPSLKSQLQSTWLL